MGVRILCLMLLGFIIACWAQVPTYKYLPDAAKFGMHIFYAGAAALMGYGIITGRAPS